MKKVQQIIAVVGMPGAGKTTIAKYLEKAGFENIKLSKFLEKEAKKQHGKINRQSLQEVGNQMRKKYGAEILAQWAMTKAGNKKKIIIDGVRNLAEIRFLRKQGNFILLGITADPKIRFERLAKIKTKIIPSWKEFLRLDNRDKGLNQSKTGLQVTKCFNEADYFIENNETLDKLYRQIDNFYQKIL